MQKIKYIKGINGQEAEKIYLNMINSENVSKIVKFHPFRLTNSHQYDIYIEYISLEKSEDVRCESCNKLITDRIVKYSKINFDNHKYCIDCQDKFRK